jgi:hypothetical protein
LAGSKAGWIAAALTMTAALIATRATAMDLSSDCDGGRLAEASRLLDHAETAWLGQVSSVRTGRTTGGGGAMIVTVNGSFRVRPTLALKGKPPKPVTGRWFMTWIDDGQIVGYKPDKDEAYLVLVGRSGPFLERAACVSGLAKLGGAAELAPSSP